MNYVLDKYNDGKLIMRAVDLPQLHNVSNEIKYDCSTWANEFAMMMNKEFESVSSTLLIPGVGVRTYKNAGFLVDSDLVMIQHIALVDSGSCGSFKNGDFMSNPSDFDKLEELADYIKVNNHTTMNEVNISIPLDSVVGLVVLKCRNELEIIKRIMCVKESLFELTGREYDIFEYDSDLGRINQVDFTDELLDSICSVSSVTKYDYYTDYSDEVYEGNVKFTKNNSK